MAYILIIFTFSVIIAHSLFRSISCSIAKFRKCYISRFFLFHRVILLYPLRSFFFFFLTCTVAHVDWCLK